MIRRFAARYDRATGQIYWRGSGDAWIYRQPEEARKLRDLFASDPNFRAEQFVRDLSEAIEAYETDHQPKELAA